MSVLDLGRYLPGEKVGYVHHLYKWCKPQILVSLKVFKMKRYATILNWYLLGTKKPQTIPSLVSFRGLNSGFLVSIPDVLTWQSSPLWIVRLGRMPGQTDSGVFLEKKIVGH